MDQGIAVTFMPAGPLIEFNPDKVKQVPTTAARAPRVVQGESEPLIYARPANSGPGRTFMMGLPYILGDKNPKDPVNGWEKTWAYLKELNTLHRVLPDGHGCGDEGARRRLARHDRDDDGLGHQPARARHRAEELQGRATQGDDLDQRRALHGGAEGRVAREAGGDPRRDGLHAYAGSAGVHLRQGLLLPGSRGEGRADRRWRRRKARTRSRSSGVPSTRPGSRTSRTRNRCEAKAQVDAFRIWDQQVGAQKTK